MTAVGYIKNMAATRRQRCRIVYIMLHVLQRLRPCAKDYFVFIIFTEVFSVTNFCFIYVTYMYGVVNVFFAIIRIGTKVNACSSCARVTHFNNILLPYVHARVCTAILSPLVFCRSIQRAYAHRHRSNVTIYLFNVFGRLRERRKTTTVFPYTRVPTPRGSRDDYTRTVLI